MKTDNLTHAKNIIKKAADSAWPENNKDFEKTFLLLMTKLLEESGEVAQACKNFNGNFFFENKTTTSTVEIEEEVGDVFVVLLRICAHYDLNPDVILSQGIEKLYTRIEKKGIAIEKD